MRYLQLVTSPLLGLVFACSAVASDLVTQKDISTVTDHSGLAPLTSKKTADNEHLSGGDTTMFIFNNNAFSRRPTPVAKDFRADGFFTSGDHLFRTPHEGIGPVLNAASCQGCHLNDGKGLVPENRHDPMTSMFLKVGDTDGNVDPMYGDQLQTFAVQGLTSGDLSQGLPKYNGSVSGEKLYGEAYAFIEYKIITGQYSDGTSYQLRQPIYKVKDFSFGPFNPKVAFSPRVAPAIFGSGLLEGIPAKNILALSDPQDLDNNGISGKAAMVKNVMTGQMELGRFAYKAQNPNVLQQASGAYRGDMGITNRLFLEESCSPLQVACLKEAKLEKHSADKPDIIDRQLALVEFYNKVLAVPARRGYDRKTKTWQPEIAAGRELFFDTGCVDCHTPRHVTGEVVGSRLGKITLLELLPKPQTLSYLSNQVIFPYTDLLLHDMGGSCKVTRELDNGQACDSGNQCLYVQRCEGLADDLPMADANGREWKTPPLWGTGLVQTVNAKATFLHDGRARNHAEAILWHGGEAQQAKDKFTQLNAKQRQQLLAFVGSL